MGGTDSAMANDTKTYPFTLTEKEWRAKLRDPNVYKSTEDGVRVIGLKHRTQVQVDVDGVADP